MPNPGDRSTPLARLVLPALMLSIAAGCSDTAGLDGLVRARQISHEMGKLDGHTYLNCLECFENAYAQGNRYIEADLMVASDGRIVAVHDRMETRFDLPEDFSSAQFMAQPLLGQYTPLDGPGLARLFGEKPDWYLVTDVKTPNIAGLTELCLELAESDVDCTERVIPQIFSPKQVDDTEALGFQRIILTLYSMHNSPDTVDAALQLMQRDRAVFTLTMPHEWWDDWARDYLSPVQVPVFLHTINSAEEQARYFSEGVQGLYTDSLPPLDPAQHSD